MDIHLCSLHFSWNLQLCMRHANFLILQKIYIKLKELKIKKLVIWLQHQSNQFQHYIEMNGLNLKIFPSNIVEFLLALEKRLVLMEKMSGAFLEFISLKKLNNSYTVHQINLGKSLIKWLELLKNSTKHLNYLTK